jgi:hypothetical protein
MADQIIALVFATALQVQYVPPPYTPYAQPSPYAAPGYAHHPLPAWAPPSLPPSSPQLIVPMPDAPVVRYPGMIPQR